MYNKKRVDDYTKAIAKEHGITKKQAREIIMYAMKNVCQMIRKGEDIQLQHFGSIYFNKKSYSNYLRKLKTSEGKSNNRPEGTNKNEE
jgi:nucleoid DNA-binding protein